MARHGGQILVFGTVSATDGALPYYELYAKELGLIGSRATRPGDYADAVAHVRGGRILLSPLQSATLPLHRIDEAVALFRDGAASLKVTLDVPG